MIIINNSMLMIITCLTPKHKSLHPKRHSIILNNVDDCMSIDKNNYTLYLFLKPSIQFTPRLKHIYQYKYTFIYQHEEIQ